ncbi:MAG: carboxypeptidase regulatory-like domain-containing protein [Bacteroidales bacterium]|jgi:hypothetical protein|nr:carboxypeptidase regulatory-like domain-containing protein [Bacteroidales bacterium]MDD2204443.1 carboxypeptidase regulatory-like domain-containing protein [Bacteroidales bacterium]MDD3913971.1 carboxypeptidase regulatory-like domain-containing protein [Bacteroidales bacterium]MDD4633763.1 carboxypeptidase regulatory-like domain-containing protein [Bacteroidales bacterium]
MKKIYASFVIITLLSQVLSLNAQPSSPVVACDIIVDMTDDYGDGWTGAAVNFIQNGVIVASVTLEDGYSGTEIVPLEEGTTDFEWVPGEYPFECGFTIKDSYGNVIYQTQGAQTIGIFYTYEHECYELPTWIVSGTVTSSATGAAIANAIVLFEGLQNITAQTDDNGCYSLDAVEEYSYNITVSAEGFNNFVETDFTQPANNVVKNFALDNPELSVSSDEVYATTTYMTNVVETIDITNTGNGTLTWNNKIEYENGKSPETVAYMINAFDELPMPYAVPLNNPSAATLIAGGDNPPFDMISGGDFFNGKWYVIDPNMIYVFSIDPETGYANPEVTMNVLDIYGLCYNVSDNKVYMKTYNDFYTLNMATGETQYCFSMTTPTFNFAITNDGRFITIDTDNDRLIEVDPATGEETVLISLGFDSNYCQGLAIDRETNTLYFAGCDFSTFKTSLYIVNLEFNNLEYIGELPGNMVGFAIPTEAGWLHVSPKQGVIEAGETQSVQLTMDGSWAETGTFLATLNFCTENPNVGEVPVIVTFVIGDENAISETNNSSIKCYPNPVANMLYISTESVSAIDKISIFNAKGYSVYENNNIGREDVEVSTSTFPTGIYFLRISCNNKTEIMKFVVM